MGLNLTMRSIRTGLHVCLPLLIMLLLSAVFCNSCSKLDTSTLSSQATDSVSSEGNYIGDRGDGYAGDSRAKATAVTPQAEGMHTSQVTGSGMSTEPESYTSKMLAEAGIDETRVNSWFAPAAYAQDHAIDDAYLIRNGDCSLEVDSYNEAALDVRAIASKYQGYISDSHSELQPDERRSGYMTLRVPRDSFDNAWADCLGLGKILKEEISTEDVSQTFVASMSRLKNLMAHQATLQKMLEEALATQRVRGLDEGYKQLIATQEKLFEVTAQIESTEDRLNALSDRIERSTISVRLSEKYVEKEIPVAIVEVKEEFQWGFGETAGQAATDVRSKFRSFTQSVLYFVISGWTDLIWPAIWIVVLVFCYRRWLKPFTLKRYGLTPWAALHTNARTGKPLGIIADEASVDRGGDG